MGCSSNLVCPVLRPSSSCHCHEGGHCENFVANSLSLSLSSMALFVNRGIVCFICLMLERCYYCVMGNRRQATRDIKSLYAPIDS